MTVSARLEQPSPPPRGSAPGRKQKDDRPDAPLRFATTLTPAERRALETLVREPYEFMEDARFVEADADARIFDTDVRLERSGTQWYDHLERRADPQRAFDRKALPLFSASEEQAAFLRYNYCRFRVEQTRLSMALPRVAATKGRTLLRWHHQALHWRELIAEHNLALVLAMSRRLPAAQVDLSEMIAEGNVALVRAIDKFRCDRGFKFSTYACRAILKAFSRAGQKEFKHRQRNPVHFDPVLERSDWGEQRALQHQQDCVDELKRIVARNRAKLSHDELAVIRGRFNLDRGDDPRSTTLEAVGRQIGLTKERVRQIQLKALAKLKETLQVEFLDGRPDEARSGPPSPIARSVPLPTSTSGGSA